MDFLLADWMGKPGWMWLAFLTAVLILIAVDLGVIQRRTREVCIRSSLIQSAVYVSLGVAFAGFVWAEMGEQPAVEYLTGFVVEWSLALDNIFVIASIFAYFAIPPSYQRRVLVWGILGVIVLRAVMIGAGSAVIAEFGWVLQVFAAFLVITGLKMLLTADKAYDVGANPVLRLMRRRFRVTLELHGERFLVRLPDEKTGKRVLFLTPLMLALVVVEIADIIFAVDSIPAIFAITTDPFIVYTSNIFAIIGLRALYFALSAMISRFVYLKHALAVVLVFIGGKIFAHDLLGVEITPVTSLVVTLSILASAVVASLWQTRVTARPASSGTALSADRPKTAV